MARRSLLGPALEERKPELTLKAEPAEAPAVIGSGSTIKPSRRAKLHIGGYYEPSDPTIISFQKLGIDLRRPQQDMLLEAIRDFVAKYQAEQAFRRE
jgi:hypothetical protein